MELLNTIVDTYVAALQIGFDRLHIYSIPLLALVALPVWIWAISRVIRAGLPIGEAWAVAITMLLSLSLYVWLLDDLQSLATSVFEAAAFFGLRVAGGVFTLADFLRPGRIVAAGMMAAQPIQDMLIGLSGPLAILSLPTILNNTIAWVCVMIAFVLIAFAVALTIIEWYFALMTSTVLIPFAIAPFGKELAEFSLGFLLGTVVRVFFQAAIMGIGIPLFSLFTLTYTAGGDPTWASSVALVVGAIFFAVLVWVLTNRATTIAAKGMALGISSDTVVHGLSQAGRGLRGATAAAQTMTAGASRMMRQARAA